MATNPSAARPDDPTDVASAPNTAADLWHSGRHSRAVQWVRRAASYALNEGYGERCEELSREAEELATESIRLSEIIE